MRAIRVHRFGGPDVMQMEDVPDPRPGLGQVVVRIHAAGVNPVDAYIRAGTHARKPPLPYTPGIDAAGEVEAAGNDVDAFAPGDRVYFSGTITGPEGAYAERALCATGQVHRLPARISFAQGAAIGIPYATAYRALFQRAAAKPGETILVHGATGAVGLATVQIAKAHRMRIIGTGGSERGLEAVRNEGADVVLDHRTPDYLDGLMVATNGRGVDLVVEMLANVNLDKDLKIVAPRGRVVVVGNRGRVEIDPRQAMNREAAILAMMFFNATDSELAEIYAGLGRGLEDGTLNPIVGRELPLSEARRAHEAVFEPGALGKIVLTV